MINNRDAALKHSGVLCDCDTYVPERIYAFRTEMCATCGRPSMKELQRILAESNK